MDCIRFSVCCSCLWPGFFTLRLSSILRYSLELVTWIGANCTAIYGLSSIKKEKKWLLGESCSVVFCCLVWGFPKCLLTLSRWHNWEDVDSKPGKCWATTGWTACCEIFCPVFIYCKPAIVMLLYCQRQFHLRSPMTKHSMMSPFDSSHVSQHKRWTICIIISGAERKRWVPFAGLFIWWWCSFSSRFHSTDTWPWAIQKNFPTIRCVLPVSQQWCAITVLFMFPRAYCCCIIASILPSYI